MQIVFGGAWALIALGIVLFFSNVSTEWVVFCVAFGAGIILVSLNNSITLWFGIAGIVAALISFVLALT